MAEQTFAGDEIPAGSQVIEVHVAELTQIFNSFDPSPFHEKDLDDDAKEFIVGWAQELPKDAPLALMVFLDKPFVTAKMADDLREAVRRFFARQSELASQRLRQLFRVGRRSLLIGVVFLALCLLAGHRVTKLWPGSGLAAIIRESLLIGGWVSMWRPLEIFLYEWWPILGDRRLYDRLGRMAVRISCAGAPMPPVQSPA